MPITNTTITIPLANSSIAGLLVSNTGLSLNSSGTFVASNNGLISTSTGVSIKANTGLKANSSGLFATSNIGLLDSIAGSFNSACTVFNLAVASSPIVPNNPQSLMVILDGVYQQPGVAYTVSGSQITFTSAPDAVDTCFIIILNSLSSGHTGNYPNTISVKDFGAMGDGVTDDTAAIQAAAIAAFQTGGVPNGQASYLNKKLYFPAGTYLISNIIQLGPLWGAEVFGDGMNSSIIVNNVLSSNATNYQGCLFTDGCAFSKFHDFTLKGVNNDPYSTLLDYDWINPGQVNATQCLFERIEFLYGGYGCAAGGWGMQCDVSTWIGCKFNYNYSAGISTWNFNALGECLFGCEFVGCGIGVYNGGGEISMWGCSFKNQTANAFVADIYYTTSDAYDSSVISGCYSESPIFVTAGFRPLVIEGCEHNYQGANGWFFYGQQASQGSGPYNISGCTSANGGIYVDRACIIDLDGFKTNVPFDNWLYIVDRTWAKLSFKNCGVINSNASIYWQLWGSNTTYAMLPDPMTCSDQRGMIRDANVSTWGSVVSIGGNSHVVPVWSNGTNWLVG